MRERYDLIQKHKKCVFTLFRAYIGQPDDHVVTSMFFTSVYNYYSSKDHSLELSRKKNWELLMLENYIFFGYLVFQKKILNENHVGIHMRGIFYFCTIEGFFRILKKTSSELICTPLYMIIYYCIEFLLSKGRNQEGGLLLSKSETDNFLS